MEPMEVDMTIPTSDDSALDKIAIHQGPQQQRLFVDQCNTQQSYEKHQQSPETPLPAIQKSRTRRSSCFNAFLPTEELMPADREAPPDAETQRRCLDEMDRWERLCAEVHEKALHSLQQTQPPQLIELEVEPVEAERWATLSARSQAIEAMKIGLINTHKHERDMAAQLLRCAQSKVRVSMLKKT